MKERYKIYVEVITKFDLAQNIIPLEIIWEDGRHFAVDKVLDVRPAASLKAGGMGQRYTVRILNRERYLWYDECDKLWFVEGK